MRWDELFDDLEAQLAEGFAAEDRAREAEEAWSRLSRLTLRGRLRAIAAASRSEGSVDARTRMLLADGAAVTLSPVAVGKDWFSAEDPVPCIVPMAAVVSVGFSAEQLELGLREESPSSLVLERTGLPLVLRDLARRRVPVDLVAARGVVAQELHGTIDRVGADHLDLALHERGAPRRSSELAGFATIPLPALVRVLLR